MQIHNRDKGKIHLATMVALLVVVVLSCVILFFFDNNLGNDEDIDVEVTSNYDIKKPNRVEKKSYSKIIGNDNHKIYSAPDLSIYLVKGVTGINKLLYVYSDKPEGRNLTDFFFVHLYVKDLSNLKEGVDFINLDFSSMPRTIEIDFNKHYMYQVELRSNFYLDNTAIPLEDILYINTGRYKPGMGRSLNLQALGVGSNSFELVQLDKS